MDYPKSWSKIQEKKELEEKIVKVYYPKAIELLKDVQNNRQVEQFLKTIEK